MRALFLIFAVVTVAFTGPAASAPAVPDFWNARERLPKPNAAALPRLRFLTTTDFPPFNYLDASGRLSGFNVDLARAICAELDMGERCQIEAMPWNELEDALAEGRGEAIIAGIAITAEMREKYEFSRSYLRFPARFVMTVKEAVGEPVAKELEGKRVGVLAGTAHEEMLRDLFPDVRIITYTKSKWMLGDLMEGGIDAAFGDGMRLSFWLGSSSAHDCCVFAGGPYLAPEYLGQGMAIAVPRGKEDLVHALDYALQEIGTGGKFGELYLRYFPISFY